jgi:hypothetical protein
MKKLKLENLKVESFDTTAAAGNPRGTVAAHDGTQAWCPVSYGGTCIITGCAGCPTDDEGCS